MTNIQQLIMLIVGSVLTLTGLIAYLVKKKDEGSNRVKGFGMEFDLRPALFVIMVGCVMLAGPQFLTLYSNTNKPSEGKGGGTESTPTANGLAHEIQFWVNWRVDLPPEQCLDNGETALKKSGFAISPREGSLVHGYANGYHGVVFCDVYEKQVFFIVSGPDGQVAKNQRDKLRQEFSVK